MNKRRLAAMVAAGLLTLGIAGFASAASVEPTFHEGNITVEGGGNNDAAACDPADAIFLNGGDSPETEGTSDNGVTVTVTYNEDKSFDFVADGGLVTIAYVKGASGYNEYNYGSPGVASDTNLVSPDAGGSGGAAAVSHLIFCTEQETVTTTTTEETTEETTTEETTEETTTTTSFTQSVGGETSTPSEPDTATIGGSDVTGSPTDSAWLLVVALGALLASMVVFSPARARSRR